MIDIESVSGNETLIADQVETALRPYSHLDVKRDGNVVLARTDLGRAERVIIAGHLDTVPVARNLPSWVTKDEGRALVWGRGACDMKGGVAVQLSAAARLRSPSRDVTWIFYDNEEIEEEFNGLNRTRPRAPGLARRRLRGAVRTLERPDRGRLPGHDAGDGRAHRASPPTRPGPGWVTTRSMTRVPCWSGWRRTRPSRSRSTGCTYREGLNAVRITGGIAGNVIPDRCDIEVNYRFAPDKSTAEAEAYVREVLDGFPLRVTDVAAGARPGLDQPAAAEFLASVGGEASAKFGWTDVARFSAMGIPAVNFGPGDPSKAHADDEFCPADEVLTCRDALVRWLS